MKRLATLFLALTAAHVAGGFVFRRKRRLHAGDRKHFLVTQGGVHVRPTADEIRDAVVSVMAGGLLLDLREIRLEERPARLDVLAIMGGVQLVVPEDWRVQADMEAVMGGVEDRRQETVGAERAVDLVLRGRVVMGGLEITATPPGGIGPRTAPRPGQPAAALRAET